RGSRRAERTFQGERPGWRSNSALPPAPGEALVSSCAAVLARRWAVGRVHCVGHPHEHLTRPLEVLPAVRGADVVHKHQVAGTPWLAYRICLVCLVDDPHDIRADRVAVGE